MFVFTIFLTLLVTCHCAVEVRDRASNFSVELLYYTAEETQWHTVISPLGVWNLLAALSMGATGNSQRQLRRGLFLPKMKKPFLNDFKTYMEDVIRPVTQDVSLKTKNYVFMDENLDVKKKFQQTLKNDFKVDVEKFQFNQPAMTASKANEVLRYSGVIEYDLFEPDDFNDAKMILTNIISFTGHWQSPFNASETHVEDFYNEDKEVIGQVNMMEQQGNVKFLNAAEINASVLILPYGEDESYSFVVILPYNGIKLSAVYDDLATVRFKDVMRKINRKFNKYGPANVNIKLPRFKISTNVILNRPLQSMGVVGIFEPEENSFNRISDTTDLYVSAIVHKAEIRVSEIGTTASASSSIYLERRALPGKFNANRPFLYFIIHNSTSTIIFSGVYSKPTLF